MTMKIALAALAASISLAPAQVRAEDGNVIPMVSPYCQRYIDQCATHGKVAGYTVRELLEVSSDLLTLERFRQLNEYDERVNEDTILVNGFVAHLS